MMAVGSFAGPTPGVRAGRERALGFAVALVAAGSLIRGIPALAPLVGGSLVIGLGIGLAGVLITGVFLAFSLAVSHIAVVTSLGLYYLMDRLYRREPRVTTRKPSKAQKVA